MWETCNNLSHHAESRRITHYWTGVCICSDMTPRKEDQAWVRGPLSIAQMQIKNYLRKLTLDVNKLTKLISHYIVRYTTGAAYTNDITHCKMLSPPILPLLVIWRRCGVGSFSNANFYGIKTKKGSSIGYVMAVKMVLTWVKVFWYRKV